MKKEESRMDAVSLDPIDFKNNKDIYKGDLAGFLAAMGVVQEGKAEKAIAVLQKMSAPNAKVIRNGQMTVIPASKVVPGDVCILDAGDIVPADMRLIESSSLKAEEASFPAKHTNW